METDHTMDRTAGAEHERRALYESHENVVTKAPWVGHTAISQESDRPPIDTQKVQDFYKDAEAADNTRYRLSDRPA